MDENITQRKLPIAVGNSSKAKFWKNQYFSWDELCDRLQTTIYTSETVKEYAEMSKSEKERAKDHGGFVCGQLKNNRRKNENVLCCSMLKYDSDNAYIGFLERFVNECKYAAFIYTTHGHTAEKPRYRIIVPLTRDISPDEYIAVSRYFANEWNIDMFDECSYKPNQLMYWASTPKDGEYICKVIENKWLNPDEYLEKHPDWQNFSTLPLSSKEKRISANVGKHQEDPLTKPGIIGAFCRAYTIEEAIDTFLSDIYAPSAVENRYDYIKGEGSAGVVIYDDKFAYSHHATDPASHILCNAFDLVRIHLFKDMDEKLSVSQMCEFAANDTKVSDELLSEKKEQAKEDFSEENWTQKLQRNKSGALVNSLHNIRLIMENDEYMKNIVFNQLADTLEIIGNVPWKHPSRFWRDADDAQLTCYVDANYGTFSARNYDLAVAKVTDDRCYHPIREYFNELPDWDGTPRVETAIIDYLGADDNDYVRAVTKKTLCAAYKRIFEPGIKFDYMPVLNGEQGIGKSTFISKLGMNWFSDSLNLSDMNDKTAAEKLQGYWIMEIGELAGMKKADIDKVKAFISRQDDKYRASFGRRVTSHPRQCIFFGTTNCENGYLRDITGNRRYWNIRVSGKGKYKPWDMTKQIVDQIWAEVMVLCKKGETLYLPPELEEYARREQLTAMEQDEREGIVEEYLDMLLPDEWDNMDIYSRRDYVRERNDPLRAKGTHKRTEVSNIEIWCECFGKPKEDMKPSDSYAVSAIMTRLPDWYKCGQRKRIPLYGQQRVFARKSCDNYM